VKRWLALLTVLGSLVSLSACGTAAPAAVGSYKVTIVIKPDPVANDFYVDPTPMVYRLLLSDGGHFVMTPSEHGDTTFDGTWSESKGFITLNTPKTQFVAHVKGGDLRHGQVATVGPGPTSNVTWSAVRT
jgi:hypothetical protein